MENRKLLKPVDRHGNLYQLYLHIIHNGSTGHVTANGMAQRSHRKRDRNLPDYSERKDRSKIWCNVPGLLTTGIW